MPLPVSDFRSNVNDQIAHAARTVGTGLKRRVFEAVYRGRAEAKSLTEICESTGLSRKQVLTAGLALVRTGIVEQTVRHNEIAYQKDHNYSHYRDKILALAADPERLRRLPTKISPHVAATIQVPIELSRELVNVRQVAIDDVDSFAEVRSVPMGQPYRPIAEADFKRGVQRIVGEVGEFHDWGGEVNDLFTTTLLLDGRRVSAAVAFKGKGTTGVLTPAKMGTNGDQIARLFESPAELYLVQYWGQLHQRIYADMKTYAVAKSVLMSGSEQIIYGVIDGSDSTRLLMAYPDAFREGPTS